MKKISLLSISNSFGVNIQTYASQIAIENNCVLDIFVLYIGGCSLEKHCQNIDTDSHEYLLYHNGECEKDNVSILETLKMKKWDYVITQQVSYLGGDYTSYYPFIIKLLNFVKLCSPSAILGLQETWEYSCRFCKKDGMYFTQKESDKMYEKLAAANFKIANELNLILIRSGDVIHLANKKFNKFFQCDDGFHLSNEGCYLIGLNLVRQLFKIELKKAYIIEGSNKSDLINYLNFVNSFR